MSDDIVVKLPADLLQLTGLSIETIETKSILIWVLELYSKGKITLSKAASLVQMKVDEFLEEFYKRRLKRIGAPSTIQQAKEDLDVALRLHKGK